METYEKDSTLLDRFRAKSDADYAKVVDAISKNRFLIGMQTQTRLNKALASIDRRDLQTKTLLTKEVHVEHTQILSKCLNKQWRKIKDKALREWLTLEQDFQMGNPKPTDNVIAASHVRFITLLDSVTLLDSNAALQAANRMRNDFQSALNDINGIWCHGAIEVEAISLKMMRRIRRENQNTESELRKFDVCEALAQEFVGTLFESEESLFLIHFHGILTADSESTFENFRKRLHTNSRWKKSSRQVEIKKLSEEFKGKKKSVEQNLDHIARYITKGGNDWDGNAICFRYKIGFDKQDSIGEDACTLRGWRRDDALKAEHQLDGIIDPLSMTGYEIGQLAIVIDGLMSFNDNKNGTGYLISSGK